VKGIKHKHDDIRFLKAIIEENAIEEHWSFIDKLFSEIINKRHELFYAKKADPIEFNVTMYSSGTDGFLELSCKIIGVLYDSEYNSSKLCVDIDGIVSSLDTTMILSIDGTPFHKWLGQCHLKLIESMRAQLDEEVVNFFI